jgi:hypothetical protein
MRAGDHLKCIASRFPGGRSLSPGHNTRSSYRLQTQPRSLRCGAPDTTATGNPPHTVLTSNGTLGINVTMSHEQSKRSQVRRLLRWSHSLRAATRAMTPQLEFLFIIIHPKVDGVRFKLCKSLICLNNKLAQWNIFRYITKTNSVAFSTQANYTDWATVTC